MLVQHASSAGPAYVEAGNLAEASNICLGAGSNNTVISQTLKLQSNQQVDTLSRLASMPDKELHQLIWYWIMSNPFSRLHITSDGKDPPKG